MTSVGFCKHPAPKQFPPTLLCAVLQPFLSKGGSQLSQLKLMEAKQVIKWEKEKQTKSKVKTMKRICFQAMPHHGMGDLQLQAGSPCRL